MTTPRTRFGYHFAKLHRLMISLYRQDILELGIKPSQIPFVAELLHHNEPLTQDELSTILVIDKAATARALEHLEKKGIVQRKINPQNRRQKLVTVTPKARALEKPLFDILQTISDIFTNNFSPEEKNQAIGYLNRMINNALEIKS